MLLFIPGRGQIYGKEAMFQYISCYSLSERAFIFAVFRDVSIHLMLLFIPAIFTLEEHQASFNTSHVTLYQRNMTSERVTATSFNTSHVTLYHVDLGSGIICINVSIHLMLLFIINGSVQRYLLIYSFNTSHVTLYLIPKQKKLVALKFQYISCYSLSKPFGQRKNALALFQYISCYSLSLL